MMNEAVVVDGDVRIFVENRSGVQVDLEPWGTLAKDTLLGENFLEGSLDIAIVAEEEMAILNREHMGKEGATDVLSFPIDETAPSIQGNAVDAVPTLFGDIVLCWQVAQSQSENFGCSLEEEISLLLIHGVLHLLGHDHAEPAETARMQSRERAHLERLGYRHRVDV